MGAWNKSQSKPDRPEKVYEGELTTGFFFKCSDTEYKQLCDMGGGDPSKGLRDFLTKASGGGNFADILKNMAKDLSKTLIDSAPQILSNFMNNMSKGRK